MPLPLTRNTTYSIGSPAKSVDLNAIQDCIIGRKHGAVELVINPSYWAISSGGSYSVNGYVSTSGAGSMRRAIPMLVGDRITAMTLDTYGDGAADITGIELNMSNSLAATLSTIATATVTNGPASWVATALTVTPTTLAAGNGLDFLVQWSATGLRIGNLRITYHHP